MFPFTVILTFPWTGGAEEVGEGEGKGFTVNVPLEMGHSDPDYGNIFRHLLFPIVRRFKPEIILVAAGFDIHHSDPLRSMNVTESGFARMTQLLMEMAAESCGKRLVLALEGGYNSEALRNSVAMVIWELTGQSMINREEMRQVEDAQSREHCKDDRNRCREISTALLGRSVMENDQ